MDGVLIDANRIIERAWREAAQLYGREITEEDIRSHIHGRPGPHTIRALFSDLSQSDQERVQAHVTHVENTADYEPIPGVARTISLLREAGATLGIVTSGWRSKIDRVVALLQVQGCFSVYVERDDVSRGKPHSEPYLLAAQRLGISASRTVVFEDSGSGVTAATSAGAYCVGIGGDELLSYGAKITISDFQNVDVRPSDSSCILVCRPGHEVLVKSLPDGV